MSTITFMWFWHDKRAAQRQHSRTPERDLLIWSLFGGWLGALAAQTWLRHKSQKRAFIIKLWVTILVHCWMFIIVAVQLVLGSDALW
ncbi:membrane protein [Pseudoalteromonas sp. SW0106-04]|nr:membrane protein [Pseudoalteromonas sp. SW0106-04]